MLKKVIAQLMSTENDDNDDEKDELLEEDNENGDYDEKEDVAANGYILNLVEEIPSVISEEDPINSKTAAMLTSSDSVKPQNSRYRVDSACRGAHIVKSAHILNTIADTSAWKKLPLVQGITGNKLGTTGVGTLADIGGTALVVPEATDYLLSLMDIVKANKGSFSGDFNNLTIRDSNDNTIIKAYNFGYDFWSCTDDDLAPTAIAFDSDVVLFINISSRIFNLKVILDYYIISGWNS